MRTRLPGRSVSKTGPPSSAKTSKRSISSCELAALTASTLGMRSSSAAARLAYTSRPLACRTITATVTEPKIACSSRSAAASRSRYVAMRHANPDPSVTTVSGTQYVHSARLSFHVNDTAAIAITSAPTARVSAGEEVKPQSSTATICKPRSTARSPMITSTVTTIATINSATARGQRASTARPGAARAGISRFFHPRGPRSHPFSRGLRRTRCPGVHARGRPPARRAGHDPDGQQGSACVDRERVATMSQTGRSDLETESGSSVTLRPWMTRSTC
jgi:hypothetical protein